MRLLISEIQIGNRRREEMGDIQGLAESIRKFGLLHPVVVDDQGRMVAGGRRLEACKLLGWEEISATFLGELSDEQLREIELEENLRRKDLTEYEKSRDMVELAKLKEETMIPTGGSFDEVRQNSEGRPPKQKVSESAIAQELGVPRTTLRDAYAHVEAVKEFPDLATLPKGRAIEIAKQAKSLPEHERHEAIRHVVAVEEEGKRRYNQRIDEIEQDYKIQRTLDDAISKAATLITDERHLETWLKKVRFEDLDIKERELERAINNLLALKEHLRVTFRGPRLVKTGGER